MLECLTWQGGSGSLEYYIQIHYPFYAAKGLLTWESVQEYLLQQKRQHQKA